MRMRASRAKLSTLQEIATTSGGAARGERARLGERAGARRIEQHGVEARQFGARRAAAGRGRASRPRTRAARRRAAGALQRRDRGGVGIGGEDFVIARQAQREGAGAAEEIGDAPRAAQRRRRALGQRCSPARRLQKAAGRRDRQHVAESDCGGAALDDVSP